jgi:hypothetical protein
MNEQVHPTLRSAIAGIYNTIQEAIDSPLRMSEVEPTATNMKETSKFITLDTEEKEQLEKLQTWADLILHNLESFDSALQKAGMTVESNLAKLSEQRLDFIAHKIEQKILGNQ